jgi:small subunit ribosomal protein S4
MKAAGTGTVPPWLKLDAAAYAGEVLSAPQRDEINTDVQEALIVEFYSR